MGEIMSVDPGREEAWHSGYGLAVTRFTTAKRFVRTVNSDSEVVTVASAFTKSGLKRGVAFDQGPYCIKSMKLFFLFFSYFFQFILWLVQKYHFFNQSNNHSQCRHMKSAHWQCWTRFDLVGGKNALLSMIQHSSFVNRMSSPSKQQLSDFE